MPTILWGQTGENVSLYQQNKLWGLEKEKPITPAVYDTIYKVKDGHVFIAKKHGKGFNATGVISSKGKTIIPFNYWKVTASTNGFIVSTWDRNQVNYGVLTKSNNIILNQRFEKIEAFDNIWVAMSKRSTIELFSLEGVLITQINADSVSVIPNSHYARIYKRGKEGLIDNNGKEIFSPSFKKIIKKEGHWLLENFANWRIFSSEDTLLYLADTVKVWDKNHTIIGIKNTFYLNKKNIPISNNYDAISTVSPSFAIIKKSSLFGAINNSGEVIMAPKFGDLYYSKGYFYTNTNNKWAVYDSLGTKRSVFKYDSIGSIANGLFPIKRKGKWGFMNRNGKEVIHCIYDTQANFSNGKAIISYYGATGIIDLRGHWIVKPKNEKITSFSSNFYIYKYGNLYYLKNYEEELIYFTANKLIFKEETIYQIKDGYTNKLTSLGTLVSNNKTEDEGSQSWQIIKIGTKYGFMDTKGLLKITYRYDSLLPFSEGLAGFKLRGKWGYINEDELIKVQPLYNEVALFKNGVSIVTKNGKKGLVEANGNLILKPKFDNLKLLEDNLWQAEEHGLTGIYSAEGKVIIQSKFDRIDYVNKDLIIVIRKGKYGVMNPKGQSIIPRMYNYIGFNKQHKLLITKMNNEAVN